MSRAHTRRWITIATCALVLTGTGIAVTQHNAAVAAARQAAAATDASDRALVQAQSRELAQVRAQRAQDGRAKVAADRAARQVSQLSDANAALTSLTGTLDGSAGKADDATRAGLSAAIGTLRTAVDAKNYDALDEDTAAANAAADAVSAAVSAAVAAHDQAAAAQAAAAAAQRAAASGPKSASGTKSTTGTSGTKTGGTSTGGTSTGPSGYDPYPPDGASVPVLNWHCTVDPDTGIGQDSFTMGPLPYSGTEPSAGIAGYVDFPASVTVYVGGVARTWHPTPSTMPCPS